MSTQPAPSASRGDILLQPAYFTSSLFVNPLKEDISLLIQLFSDAYAQSDKSHPFQLFKNIWETQGWGWFHLKVFDPRGREKFYNVVFRSLAERMVDSEPTLTRVVALFGLYTFFFSQPFSSFPPIHSTKHIAVPIDLYDSILNLPSSLTDPGVTPLRLYATHVLAALLDAQVFHILPHSSLQPHNPSVLPREICIPEGTTLPATLSASASPSSTSPTPPDKPPPKKKGRPSKRERAKRARDAVNALDKWLDKSTTYVHPPDEMGDLEPTHTLIAHGPSTSRNNYANQKEELLNIITQPDALRTQLLGSMDAGDEFGKEALMRANEAVLARLKKIDEMAAEKGLEVGGEGGEMTGLTRVEAAVAALKSGTSRGGILDLLEGVGREVQTGGSNSSQGET